MRVLVAEDNEVNRLVASELLQLAGCHCTMVPSMAARRSMRRLRNSFDVILMDCQMPELDGFEATRLIRETEQTELGRPHRTIIALTANAIKGDREQCLAAGMDGYVTKPIDPAELFRAIAEFISPERLARIWQHSTPPQVSAASKEHRSSRS